MTSSTRDFRVRLTRPDLVTLAAVMVPLALYVGWIYGRIGDFMVLPDYGDLWRLALSTSADGTLTATEAFSEVEVLGHTTVATIVVAHLSASGASYQLMWTLGAIGLVCGAGVVGLAVRNAVASHATPVVATVVGSLAGLLAFRFEVPNMAANSLLIFEQLYYALTYVSIFLVVRLVERSTHAASLRDGLRSNRNLAIGLIIVLVLADAPGSVLVLVLLPYAVATSVFRSRLTVGLQIAALSAIGSLVVRWIVRVLAGAHASRSLGSLSDLFKLQTFDEGLRLLGSAMVNLTPFVDDSSSRDSIHLVIGLIFVALAAVAVVGSYRLVSGRNRDDEHGSTRLLVTTALFSGYVALASFSIAIARDLTPGYHTARFVRSTALTVPAMALVLVALAVLIGRPPKLMAFMPAAAFVLLIALLRLPAFSDTPDYLTAVTRGRTAAVQALCDDDDSPERWTRFWRHLGDNDRIPTLLDSDLFPDARARCVTS